MNQHIVKCINYEVAVIKDDLVRNGQVEKADFVRYYDPDTSEEWRFLAEPENRVAVIEKLAEGIAGAERTKLIQALSRIEIATSMPGGTA